jgi:predicted GNAT family acetyltransferase
MTDPNQAAPTMRNAEASTDPADSLDEDQKVLMNEVADGHGLPLQLTITRDDEAGIYDATVGSQQVGGLTYNDDGERVVLVAVSILPQFRNQGAATTLIQHVLDDLLTQGRTATVLCPIVRTFIDKHAEYQDVVDQEHPGVVRVAPR